jgi:uncharacterized membrane protein YphA (DoxX/SURF4 family)
MIALVALRVTIGLHFSVEGINKFVDPKPFTAGFLRISKGPFTPIFRAMVWDDDGLARLDRQQTREIWDKYRERAVKRFRLDEKQAKAVEAIQKRRQGQLDWVFSNYRDEIYEYEQGIKRRDDYRKQIERKEVASLRDQLTKIEMELTTKRYEFLPDIDRVWAGYESDMNEFIAAADKSGALSLPKAGRKFMDSIMIDVIIRWFDVAVGVCLISGLCTRLASLGGAVFLLSICASQWPGYPGAAPVWYQFIEAVAMMVLAATAAGQYAGFDGAIVAFRKSCCPPKEGT